MASIKDDKKAAQFARRFLETYLAPAFGAISKSEVDNLVFGLLVEAGEIDASAQAYEIARALNVTPAKARNLLFQYQLRRAPDGNEIARQLSQAISNVRFAKDGDLLTFGIESPLLREELRSRFKKIGVFTDASFSAEIVRVPVAQFVEFMDSFFGAEHKAKLTAKLVKDRQIEDKSFKAVATKVIKGLAGKALGKAGDAVVDGAADVLGPFIKALFAGDADQARKQSDIVFV